MTVRPRRSLTMRFTVDGQARRPAKATDETVVAAEKTLAVTIADLVDIEVTAGEESARQAAAKLRRRWAKQGAPVLARHGVDTLEELEALRQRADADLRAAVAELDNRLQALRSEIAAQRDQVTRLRAQLESRFAGRRRSARRPCVARPACPTAGRSQPPATRRSWREPRAT